MLHGFADQAFNKLLKDYEFNTVLDVGCGEHAKHAKCFHEHGKIVTAVDLNPPVAPFRVIKANYMHMHLPEAFDCVWLSHVLEHQLDIQSFLTRVSRNLKGGGILAVTVPPLKHPIVGGHVSLWNMGLLFYRLILAGFDCRKAVGKKYDYNISVIVRKVSVDIDWPSLSFDSGDIEKLSKYFPESKEWKQGFWGDVDSINWG